MEKTKAPPNKLNEPEFKKLLGKLLQVPPQKVAKKKSQPKGKSKDKGTRRANG